MAIGQIIDIDLDVIELTRVWTITFVSEGTSRKESYCKGLLTLIEEFRPKETCLKQIIMDPFCLEILNNESF